MINVGIDLVEIKKIKQLLRLGDFIERCFSKSEIQQYTISKKTTYLAGRYAAKEAVVKALGTGIIDGLSLTDIEITRLHTGAPNINLSNRAAQIANELGITRWIVSISHTDNYATAIVIAE